MKLEKVSLLTPPSLVEFLVDLGDGENGFGGTPVPKNEMSLPDYLQSICDMFDSSKVKPDMALQTNFWMLDSDNIVVGMLKIRHWLTERTRINAGHIGYYIHREYRGRGYGKKALELALVELQKLGETEALITVFPDNAASIKVAEANGGKYSDTVVDPLTGNQINRYWIDLNTQIDDDQNSLP